MENHACPCSEPIWYTKGLYTRVDIRSLSSLDVLSERFGQFYATMVDVEKSKSMPTLANDFLSGYSSVKGKK